MKRLILAAVITAATLTASGQQKCKGTTKAGQPCKSIMVSKDGYCRQHSPNAKHCTFIKKDKTRCKMVVKENQALCRFHAND